MPRIHRDHMLELTRRMTVNRNAMTRIAGCYIDSGGELDGTFNTNFLNLSASEKKQNLAIAKTIPFAETNKKLKRYFYGKTEASAVRRLLVGLKECRLKNDALLDTFYELTAEGYHCYKDYAVFFFHSTYDIPVKGTDKADFWDSEEVYEFLICAFLPVFGEYEPGEPEFGFIFPAFCERTGDPDYIDIYEKDPENPHKDLYKLLGLNPAE